MPLPIWDHVGIALEDRDVVDADPQLVGGDLRERGLEPLPVGRHPGQERDPAHGIRADRRVLPEPPEEMLVVGRPGQAVLMLAR